MKLELSKKRSTLSTVLLAFNLTLRYFIIQRGIAPVEFRYDLSTTESHPNSM